MSLRNARINYKQADKIVEIAMDFGLEVEIFESVLLDEAIIYADNHLFIKGLPRAKYIILQEIVLNEWSSELQIICSNSDKRAEEFVSARQLEEENY